MGRGPKPAKSKEAKPPVARKRAKDEDSRVHDLEKRLAEALQREAGALTREAEALGKLQTRDRDLVEAQEQQTATSEILRVISQSPTDVQPIFDTIARNAMRLCEGAFGIVTRYDGEMLHVASQSHVRPEGIEVMRAAFPTRPRRDFVHGRVILDGTVVHVVDVYADTEYSQAYREALRLRSVLAVPMLHDGRVIGAIGVGRSEVRPFTDTQIALLQTFADQAVIAIENVRLFNETKEALEQQTATSEILRVISQSPTDVQPVFDAIVRSASRFCGGEYALAARFDGELLHLVAQHNARAGTASPVAQLFPRPALRDTSLGRAILDCRVVHVPDARNDRDFDQNAVRAAGLGAVVAIPMLRDGQPIGVIGVSRSTAGLFPARQVELLQTFADQAVIAIENVRLFTELQEKNRALTQAHAQVSEALEQQTATAEILRVISSSPTDVQPVFETIARSAARLCEAFDGMVRRVDGDVLRLVAHHGPMPATRDVALHRGTVSGLTVIERRVIHVEDLQAERDRFPEGSALARERGHRTTLSVPLIREDVAIGIIQVRRDEVRPFSDQQVALLKTFAAQAVIAVENVRLFKELEASNEEIAAKSRQIEVASQHKSEFLANMSHELRTPLNAIIGFSEVLSERMFGDLNEKQDEYLKDIYASGTHLLSLINDILDLSKIEAGRMELELSDFHLPTALDSALTLVRERAGRRSIALHVSVDERLGQIQADERKVRQVVLNLLSNAIKFTPEGGRIDVRATPQDGLVEVSVSDTGVGIAPEDQEAVFEEFRQVGTADKKVEGTGLGLTLCRKFVELHGGKIWVRSQLGAGSTFTFTIPVHKP